MPHDEQVLNEARRLIFMASKQATPKAMQQLDELVLHTGGVVDHDDIEVPECGIVALGDWNCTYKEGANGGVEHDDDTMPKLGQALEKLGIVLDWNDCYEVCPCCDRLVCTNPTSYGWLPGYAEVPGVGSHVCTECLVEDHVEAYLESLEGINDRAVAIAAIDPAEHDYRQIIGDCENGWHGGQDDDPNAIGKALRKLGIARYVFKVDSVGQFDTCFSVYVHKSERRKFNRKRFERALEPVEDPARVMERYLQDATAKMGHEPGVHVSQPDPDHPGKAIVKTVSPLDFVEGRDLQ